MEIYVLFVPIAWQKNTQGSGCYIHPAGLQDLTDLVVSGNQIGDSPAAWGAAYGAGRSGICCIRSGVVYDDGPAIQTLAGAIIYLPASQSAQLHIDEVDIDLVLTVQGYILSEIGYVLIAALEDLAHLILSRHKAADLPYTASDCSVPANLKAGAGVFHNYIPATETISCAGIDFFAAYAQKLLVGEVLIGSVLAVQRNCFWRVNCHPIVLEILG